MQFNVTFQHINSRIPKSGVVNAKSESFLIKLLAAHGYHAVKYHEHEEDSNHIKEVILGREDSDEAEQSREVC